MKNKTLFFVAILSLFVTILSTGCGSKSGDKVVSNLQSENQTLAEANGNKDILIADQQRQIKELEAKIDNPVKISTENFNYYKFQGTSGITGAKFYKIISLVIPKSDPVITEGAEGDNGGQSIEFVLESVEPQPIRVIGSKTYYYDEKGRSTIPTKIKIGNQIVLDDFYEGQEGG